MKRKLIGVFVCVLTAGFLINLISPFDLAFIDKTPAWILFLLGIPVAIYLIFELVALLPAPRDPGDGPKEDR